MAQLYMDSREIAFEAHCKARREMVTKNPESLPRTLAVVMLNKMHKVIPNIPPEAPFKRAARRFGFELVKNAAYATITISKQQNRHLIGFGGHCRDTQAFNQIPELIGFHEKGEMWNLFLAFEKTGKDPSFKAGQITPATHLLSNKEGCEAFINAHTKNRDRRWLIKEGFTDNGLGVHLLSEKEIDEIMNRHIEQLFREEGYGTKGCHKDHMMITQLLIHPPLLIDRHFKIDFRVYAMIQSTEPWAAFVYPIFVGRRSEKAYSMGNKSDGSEQNVLTLYGRNQASWMSQLSPLEVAERTGFTEKWVTNLYRKFKVMISQIFSAMRHFAPREKGSYTLVGFDFILDSRGKVWFIELNFSPELSEQGRTPWRINLQVEMAGEILKQQWARMMETAAEARGDEPKTEEGAADPRGPFDRHARAMLAAAENLEAVQLERSDGSVWEYHKDAPADSESDYLDRLRKIGWMKATERFHYATNMQSCPPGQEVKSADECRIAGPSQGYAFLSNISDGEAPSGCFFQVLPRANVSFFNNLTNTTPKEGCYSICGQDKKPKK